jgi:hypothetical protein
MSMPASASGAAKESWSVVPSPNEGPAPQSSQLLSVSCPSATACMAVGTYRSRRSPNATLAESWDGETWSIVPSPNLGPAGKQDVLNGVSCTSASACAAVGAYFINLGANRGDLTRALAESWDGKTWSIVQSPNGVSASGSDFLSSVACATDRSCMAVGYRANGNRTLIESWDGTRWSMASSPNVGPSYEINQLAAVSCSSTRDCTAVGFYTNGHNGTLPKTLVESWDGRRWSIVPSANVPGRGDGLNGVSCASAATCMAVGSYRHPVGAHFSPAATLVESWDGRSWSIVPSPNEGLASNSDELNSVSCASSTTCVAVGSTPANVLVESWEHGRWALVAVPAQRPAPFNDILDGVSCVSATSCRAVGFLSSSGGVTKTVVETS